MGIKITVIGAGSSYTPELFFNLLDPDWGLEIEQVCLLDIQAEKQALIASVCKQIVDTAGLKIGIATTTNQQEAIEGADFIILQMRVGGLAARVRDETVPMEFGMVGNETTGAGGFACALRTIPMLMNIAGDIERFAPNAWLLNLANPAGILTETLLKYSHVRTIGFCNIPINTTYDLAQILGVSPPTIQIDSFGLNHLSWIKGVYVDGSEVLQSMIAGAKNLNSPLYQQGLVESLIHPDWLTGLGMLPSWYLRYYYYPAQVLEEARAQALSDGQQDMVAEDRLHAIYADSGYNQEARKILEAKGGARYYLPVLQVIKSMLENRGEIVIVDVRNGASMPDLPQDVCVEVPARIYQDRIEPVVIGSVPLCVRGLIQVVKTYEELTIEAAMTGQRERAVQALAIHPLVGSVSKAQAYYEEVLSNEHSFLTQFDKD